MDKQFRWILMEALCGTFGCAFGLLFMIFTMVATSTLFVFITTVLIIIGGIYAIKFIVFLHDLDHDDVDFTGGRMVMKDTYKEPKPWKYSIIALIIVILCVIGGFWEMQRSLLEKWTEKCKHYGLDAKCTDADICEASCGILNKTYYLYKPGRQDECWCRLGNSTERIY